MNSPGNQFDNYQGSIRAIKAYENNIHVKSAVDAILESLRENPGDCCVPARVDFKMRQANGPRLRLRVRAVVYHASGYEAPPFGFGTPTCGTKGCVNPEHQHALTEIPTAMTFTRVAPKVPVPSSLSASALGV